MNGTSETLEKRTRAKACRWQDSTDRPRRPLIGQSLGFWDWMVRPEASMVWMH